MIALRAHHVFCLLHYVGKGYDAAFTANMDALLAALRAEPAQRIRLCAAPDVLCAACPRLRGAVCESEARVRGFDARAMAACGWRAGQTLPWALAEAAARTALQSPGALQGICGGCEWKCHSAIAHVNLIFRLLTH
ncbi:MAG: DUF1284 domain-containing protein [Oscillospiraceae bacterium]|jgi:hypothetical protein|nr:DUF1284 domain-containing protein [Oscillospiraceae bacterium]